LLDTPDNLLFSWHIIHPIHARIGFLLSAAEALLRPDIRNSNASHCKKVLDSLSRLLKQTESPPTTRNSPLFGALGNIVIESLNHKEAETNGK
jgi:hypothetical protein